MVVLRAIHYSGSVQHFLGGRIPFSGRVVTQDEGRFRPVGLGSQWLPFWNLPSTPTMGYPGEYSCRSVIVCSSCKVFPKYMDGDCCPFRPKRVLWLSNTWACSWVGVARRLPAVAADRLRCCGFARAKSQPGSVLRGRLACTAR